MHAAAGNRAAGRAEGDLDRRRVHLYTVRPESIRDPDLLAAYDALLSPEERARGERFRFPQHRHQHLVTRALLRTTLSRYADVAASSWTFRENAHGRPEIEGPAGAPPLCFNLSHTNDYIVCLVALDREIGVDVEDSKRRGETVAIADRYFSPSEVAALRRRPAAEQRARFFEYWTLKESYIKARGMGLSIPLDRFSFHLDEGGPIRISFDPRLADDPRSWQFAQWRDGAHFLALGIRRRDEPDLAIERRAVVPLRD